MANYGSQRVADGRKERVTGLRAQNQVSAILAAHGSHGCGWTCPWWVTVPWNGRSEACLLVAISALSEVVFVSRAPYGGICGEIPSGVGI